MVRRLLVLVALGLLLIGSVGVKAQDGSPVARGGVSLDLAAMALTAGNVPEGFFDDYSEWWVPGAAIDGVIGGETTPEGLERAYQSFYVTLDGGMVINVFLLEFESPEAAEAGEGIVDAAVRPPLPEGVTVGPSHAVGPEIGEGTSSTTAVTFDTTEAGGPLVDVVAVSFRRDQLVAGISIERYSEGAGSGTPSAVLGAPEADPAQVELATGLAGTLDGRIADVMAGVAPSGVDLALARMVLPLEQLVPEGTPVLGGYKAGIDLLRCGVCGEENSLGQFAETAKGGLVRAVSAGPLVDGEPTPPFVAVSVSAYETPEDALAVLEGIRQAPNDLPTAYPVPRGVRSITASRVIPGATATLAYQAAINEDDPSTIDSAGIDYVVGNWLVTVDVQGGLTADAAMAAAVDLATQQAGCLVAGESCDAVAKPVELEVAG